MDMTLYHVCEECPHSAKQCNGPRPCALDGIDVLTHISQRSCPDGRFDANRVIDPSVLANIQAQQRNCKSCGDGPLPGI